MGGWLPSRPEKGSALTLSSKAKSFVSIELLKREALDPTTPIERLLELVRIEPSLMFEVVQNAGFSQRHLQAFDKLQLLNEDEHLSLLAKNPHLSKECLLELAHTHPTEVLENPAFPLVLLEDPSFLQKVSGPLLIELLKRPNPPQELFSLAAAWDNRDSYEEFVQLPNLPAEILEDLAWNADVPFVRLRALIHPNLPRATAVLIARSQEEPFQKTLEFSSDELRMLSTSDKQWHREIAARHPKTPIDCLFRLGSDVQSWVRILIASNPSTPVDLLDSMTRAEPDFVAYWCRRTDAPSELLEKLLDQSVVNQLVAARSPVLSAKWFSILFANPKIHTNLAENPSLPAFMAEKIYTLNRDSQPLDRYGRPYLRDLEHLAENEACPLHLLETMAIAEELSLRSYSAKNPNLPFSLLEKLINDPEPRVRSYAALNPKLNHEQFSRLCSDTEERVRSEAAHHPALNEEQLSELANDPSREVRVKLLWHKLPEDLLQKLTQDTNRWLRECAQLSLERRALLTGLVAG
jgi:hypothetical protein